MCGINGITGIADINEAQKIVGLMNQSMQHRGPNDEGTFVDENIALGHRRLSIIDLSNAGHQPMFSENKKIVVAFNGEIYNFLSLKKQLPHYTFKTNTDTEVILAAYLHWGIQFIEKLDGMFAIALYDIEAKTLCLIRDRLGVKPLYYAETINNEIIFASEIRSILASGKIKKKLNISEITNYLTFQTTLGNDTLVEGIKLIEAGSMAVILNNEITFQKYWQINPPRFSEDSFEKAKIKTKDLVIQAVEKRLMSDVPLGAFLSGGIDSSAVVAAMSECGIKANTYNINFNEKEFSEAKYATLISKKYNTNHTQIDLTASDFLTLLPKALSALDHPSTDGTNTYVVSKAVKDAGISVALSGIGGDEWFGGYPVFNHLKSKKLNALKLIPTAFRKPIFNTLGKIKDDYTAEKKYELLSNDINVNNSYLAVRKLFTKHQITQILKSDVKFNLLSGPQSNNYTSISIAEWRNYLMPVLLRDTDQMGMAHALEIREPFLDYKLVEYILSLPEAYKKDDVPKSLLVNAMGNLLPKEIVERPKKGFVLPWEHWLKNELKRTVNEGLDVICNHDAFNAFEINNLRHNYFNSKQNIRWNMIWNIVVLGIWMKNNEIE